MNESALEELFFNNKFWKKKKSKALTKKKSFCKNNGDHSEEGESFCRMAVPAFDKTQLKRMYTQGFQNQTGKSR